MSIELSSVEQNVSLESVIIMTQVLNKECTLFEGSREGGLNGGSMVYFIRYENCPTLGN